MWLQYGEPRTTSTVQFQILVVYGWLLCGGPVANYYLAPSGEPVSRSDTLTVIKIHRTYLWKPITLSSSKPIDSFISVKSSNTPPPKDLAKNTRVRFIQSRSEVEKNGVTSMLLQYAPLFGFDASSPALARAARWLELWSITRICCGPQMSAPWRDALHALKQRPLESMPPGTHQCQSYNLTHVEVELLEAHQAAFGDVGDTKNNNMQPGQCKCSIQATIERRLEFNAPAYFKTVRYHTSVESFGYASSVL